MNDYIQLFISEKYIYILYLFCVLFLSTCAKQYNIFQDIYKLIFDRFKSKKVILFLISCIGGILPIPGRIIVSAGVMDTVVKKQHRIGILNYLATHHYYWWSPLEKTVIIPIALFGLTYFQFMQYTIIPLIISLVFCFTYLLLFIKEEDITLIKFTNDINYPMIVSIIVSLVAIICMTIIFDIYIALLIANAVSLLLLILCDKSILEILKQINYKILALLYVVILATNLISFYQKDLLSFIEEYSKSLSTLNFTTFGLLSMFSFIISWILGSSEKYIMIAGIICSAIGIEYLSFFMILNFCAYLISPTHKCVVITNSYFNTTYIQFLRVVIVWIIILMVYAFITLL